MASKLKMSKGNLPKVAERVPSSVSSVSDHQLPSFIQVVILVEADIDLSPYIYHMNDQPKNENFFVLNDKKILKLIEDRASVLTESKSDKKISKSVVSGDSVQIDSEPQVESLDDGRVTREMVEAIKLELARIEKIHRRPNSTTTLSSLVKRGKVKVSEDSPSVVYVLISTMYDPNLPRLLIESNVPVRAIIRLVEDKETSQQPEFPYFYDNYLKQYPFRNKLKRHTKLSGNCPVDTKEMREEIETFWKSLNKVRKEFPQVFQNTIFVDCVTPYLNLGSCKGNLRVIMESYRKILFEDIRSVQVQIGNIARAHQCYLDRMVLQNMRALNKLEMDALEIYKDEITTSGSNIPCIVDGIAKQVEHMETEPNPSDNSSTSPEDSSAMKSIAISTEEQRTRVKHLASVLLDLTNKMDKYYFVCETPKRINIIHAQDSLRLSLFEHSEKYKTYETTMLQLRTFVNALTRDYFVRSANDLSPKLIDHAKSFINQKLIDPNEKPGQVEKSARKSFNNKKFYLSYYLSLPLLELRSNTLDTVSDIRLTSSGFNSLQEDYSLGDIPFEEASTVQDVKSKHVLDLEPNIRDILHQLEQRSLKHIQATYNYTENYAPDAMMQVVLSCVSAANRVALTRLSITGDLLIQCLNESHSTTEQKFSIPTPVGLSDFYHIIIEEDDAILRDLIPCTPETASSQPSTDRCHSTIFLPPDSIKYEQSLSDLTEQSSGNIDQMGRSTKNLSDHQFKFRGYKYGMPHYVENKSSEMVRWFDRNVKLKIEKNSWTHKHMEYISVACHIRSYRHGDISQPKDHVVYNHVQKDIIQGHIVYSDFRIHLNTGMHVFFKKNSMFNSLNLLSESHEHINNENSVDALHENNSSASVKTTSDLVYDQSTELVHKFALFSPKYFPILCCTSGLTIDITNDSASLFCIEQYFTTRDVFPSQTRKYLLNASVLCSGGVEDEILVMSATGETFLDNKSNLSRDPEMVNWTIRSAEGDDYRIQDGKRTLTESSRLKVTLRENLEEYSLCLKREDGLAMHFCEDSSLDVMYPDGTHFITRVFIEDVEDEFVLVSITVRISHTDYFTVFYNYSEASITLSDDADFELKVLPSGSFEFHFDTASSARVDTDYLVWELKDVVCGDVSNRFEFQLAYQTPDTTLLSLRNAEEELRVDYEGNVHSVFGPDHDEASLDQVSMPSFYTKFNSHPVHDPTDASRFFILSPDFSGFEILSSAAVEALLTLVKVYQKTNPGDFVLQVLDSLHPYYSTFISRALSKSDSVSLPCAPQSRYPSTYGADWWHPFQSRLDSSCPSPSSLGWMYRLFHRVNRPMDDIINLFLQALEVTETSGDASDIERASEDMMERICLGNVTLKSVKERDVAFIRKCVDAMVLRAFLLFRVESVRRQTDHLLGILTHRPIHSKKKKKCPKVQLSCEKFDVTRCFDDG